MDRDTPGTLTPLWFFMAPLFSTRQRMVLAVVSSTVRRTSPSSSRMLFPALTSWGSAA